MSLEKPGQGGGPITSRLPVLFHEDLASYRARPDQAQGKLERNGVADEVVFIHQESGHLETPCGTVPYRRGDYVMIPRTTLPLEGIPHGPQPRTNVNRMEMDRTEEMAVMFETDRRRYQTLQALELDDPSYPLSWLA